METKERQYSMIVGIRCPTEHRKIIGYYPGLHRHSGEQKISGWTDLLQTASALGHLDNEKIGETEEESRLIWESLGDSRIGFSLHLLLFDEEIEIIRSVHDMIETAADNVLTICETISDITSEEENVLRNAHKTMLEAMEDTDPFNIIHHLGVPETAMYYKVLQKRPYLSELEKAIDTISEARNILEELRYDTGRISAGTYLTRY